MVVEIVIDQETLETLVIILAPIVGWIITELKRRLAESQGADAYSEMKERANMILDLAEKFPATQTLAQEYRSTAVHAELLWKDPQNNSAELKATLENGKLLLNEIFRLIGEYSPAVIEACNALKKK